MHMRWSRLYRGTPAEHVLEDAVAALGIPYRTQMPLFLYGARYFPDFLLPTLGVVFEVDDESHFRLKKQAEDVARTEDLSRTFGYKVARCTNENALNDPHGTVRAMLSSVGMWPLPKRLPKLVTSLPTPKKAPQKERRAAKSKTTQAKRQESAGRRTPEPSTHDPAETPARPSPAEGLTPTPEFPAVDWSAFD